jgi:hypothetical protein
MPGQYLQNIFYITVYLYKLIVIGKSKKDSNLEFILDLHAHHSLLGTFLYGNSYDDFLRFTYFSSNTFHCIQSIVINFGLPIKVRAAFVVWKNLFPDG